MNKKLIKIACAGLAGILLFNSIQYIVSKQTLNAEARVDTLPGVELIRENALADGTTYKILEIVPDINAAEVGFYVAGQEPFALLSNDDGTWISWKDKLRSYDSRELREKFMSDLYKEYREYVTAYPSLFSAEDAPFVWEMADTDVPYAEYTADELESLEGTESIVTVSESKRGFFRISSNGRWHVVFRRLTNVLDLDPNEVWNGTNRVYYSAESAGVLRYVDLFLMMKRGDETPIYREETGGYYTYIGTAEEIWSDLLSTGVVSETDYTYDEETGAVSGNNLSVNGDIITVSGNDGGEDGYHIVNFIRITNNPDNKVPQGTELYTINPDMTFIGDGAQYEMIETQEGLAAGDEAYTNADVVYFRGGISSADYFREQIFGFDSTEDRAKTNFKIEVTSMTPAMLTSYLETPDEDGNTPALDFNLIYIGNADFKDELADRYYVSYRDAGDMSFNALSKVFTYVVDKGIPCIVDAHAAFTYRTDSQSPALVLNHSASETTNNSYFQSLVGLLMAPVSDKAELLNALTEGTYYCNTFVSNYFGNGLVQKLEGADSSYWDLHYVTGNVYVYNGHIDDFIGRISYSENAYPNLSWDVVKIWNQKEVDSTFVYDAGFGEVAREIYNENLYREADASSSILEWGVSESTTLAYIIHYSHRRTTAKSTDLNVLEIQPAYIAAVNNNGETPNTLTPAIVAGWTGVDANHITIHTMQMSEFVGKLDDLNATYDMIYIGGRTSGFNVDSAGNTVYNDESMKGLVYSHVGDEYVIPSRMFRDAYHDNNYRAYRYIGLMANEKNANGDADLSLSSVTYRFSGNDLTTDKYNALMEYYWAGYPIVVGSDLLDSAGNVSTYKVDNSSYVYEFLNTILGTPGTIVDDNVVGKQKWVFTENELGSEGTTLFRFYITRSKLSLKSATGKYVDENGFYNENGNKKALLQSERFYSINDQVQEIEADQNGNHFLSFKFQIENSSGASYTSNYKVQLYVDSNADGKYSLSSEELLNLGIEGAPSIKELKAGTVYTVTKQLPSAFKGCISWKLVVSQVDNPYVRTSVKGYARLLTEDNSAAVINILQIVPGNNTLDLSREIGTWNDDTGSYNPNYQRDTNHYFYKAADGIKDTYILKITSVQQSTFNGWSAEQKKSILNYDMLILGFADASATLTKESVSALEAFIKSGKSVLLSHDFAQYYFNPYNDSGSNAYWVTRDLRAMLGMDAYGVSRNNYGTVLANGYGLDLTNYKMSDYTGLDAPAKNDSGLYSFNTYDVAYTPRDARNSTVGQVHGLNNWFLNLLHYADTYGFRRNMNVLSAWNGNGDWGGQNGRLSETGGNNGASFNTYTVRQENDGQITNYPYKISNDGGLVNVALTHSQWLNLDMYSDKDGDGQTDMVVWYTLYKQPESGRLTGSKALALNMGDVTNNYYIYNFGNVTYTGMGHSAATTGDCITEMEAKLFINTMVASYNTGIRTPSVTTTDNEKVTSTFYGYYDADVKTALDDTITVGFSITDLNMATQKNEEIQFVRVSKNEAGEDVETNVTSTLASQVTVKNGSTYVPVVDGKEGSPELIESGSILSGLSDAQTYYVEIPVEWLVNSGSESYMGGFKILVRSKITKNTSGAVIEYPPTQWAEAEVHYISVSLFALD